MICADCALYRKTDRFHGTCTHLHGAPLCQVDESRQVRMVRWNNLACDGFTKSLK